MEFCLCFYLQYMKGERGKGEKKGGGEEGLEFFYRFFCKFIPMYIVSLYLCIWGGVECEGACVSS